MKAMVLSLIHISADIVDRGIVLTGGGALLRGMDTLIERKTGVSTLTVQNAMKMCIRDSIMSLPERTKLQLLAPVVRGRKGTHVKLLEQAKRSGFVRVQIDGSLYELSEEIKLDKNIKHNIEDVYKRQEQGEARKRFLLLLVGKQIILIRN